MNGQPPVVVSLLLRDFIYGFHKLFRIEIFIIVIFIAVPFMINAEIDVGVGIIALCRIIENPHCLFKLGAIQFNIVRVHVIPDFLLVDFICNDPVRHKAVLFAGISLGQKTCNRLQVLAPFFVRSIERIVICICIFISGKGMNHLRVFLVPVIQNYRRTVHSAVRQVAEQVIITVDAGSVKFIGFSLILIQNGGKCLVIRLPHNMGKRDVINGIFYTQIRKQGRFQHLRVKQQSLF